MQSERKCIQLGEQSWIVLVFQRIQNFIAIATGNIKKCWKGLQSFRYNKRMLFTYQQVQGKSKQISEEKN